MTPPNLEEKDSRDIVTAISEEDSIDRPSFDKNDVTTFVLIESRPLLQRCLSRWLTEDFDRAKVVARASVPDGAASAGDGLSADLVLWSIGSEACAQPHVCQDLERIKSAFPRVPVVLLADREDFADIAEAIRYGARGYIPTSLDRREIAEILRFVRLGGTFVPASVILEAPPCAPAEGVPPDAVSPFVDLTPRELEVVDLLRQAKSNKVIAYELDLSESTVKVIVHRILSKLNAANRTEVACLALKYLESQPRGGQDAP